MTTQLFFTEETGFGMGTLSKGEEEWFYIQQKLEQ